MENQFNNVLNGIQTLMTVEIQSIRNAGLANNDGVAADFWQKVRAEISIARQRIVLANQQLPKDEFKMFISKTQGELLNIMNSPRPDFAKEGFYISPTFPYDPLYFWAYQDLDQFKEWIRATYLRDPNDLYEVPPAYLELAQYDFVELNDYIKELAGLGISKTLLNALTEPFTRRLPPETVTITRGELLNLWNLKSAIMDCREFPVEQIPEALYRLLYALNINTVESVMFCKSWIRRLLEQVDTVAEKLMVLAHCEWSIRQITTVNLHICFDGRDRLADELLRFIADAYAYYAKIEALSASVKAQVLEMTVTEPIKINRSNQQYALHMRVLEENGFFVGTQKDVIGVTGRMVLSDKNLTLGAPTHAQNFKTPTAKTIADTYEMFLIYVIWMHVTWGDEYGLPDITTMPPEELKKYFFRLKTAAILQKRSF